MRHPRKPTLGDIPILGQLKATLLMEQAKVVAEAKRLEEAEKVRQADIAAAKRAAEEAEELRRAEVAEMQRRKKLYDCLIGRGVTALLHFTRISNLRSILKNGLMPRSNLEQAKLQYAANDGLRLDGIDGVCLSVEFPNYKMFWYFKQTWPKEDWVILDISPRVVEAKSCIFNPRNAASSEMTKHSEDRRARQNMLEAMFFDEEIEGASEGLRSSLKLPDYYTTDPQAEIIVTETIEPEFFDGILIDCLDSKRQTLRQRAEKAFGKTWADKFHPMSEIFKWRHDYKYWKKS